VGNYATDFTLTGQKYTDQHLAATGEQGMYEAYACIRKGDGYVYMIEAGGHTRMAVADAVVVRDQQGLINPNYSFVISTEQGSTTRVEGVESTTQSTWKVNYKYTFANLYYDGAIPVTCEELQTGEMEPVECKLVNEASGYAGIFSGTVESNYQINSLTLTITDSAGNVAFQRPYYPSVERSGDYGTYHHKARGLNLQVEMANFSTCLQDAELLKGETYSYTVVVSLATGDKFEVKNDTFTLGSAQ
jgi:hypothetical protein